MNNMYKGAKTWNVFRGCKFDCSYCKPSFQAQAKRQRKNCEKCYTYEPHMHLERMTKIPKADIVFACGNGDIAFCSSSYLDLMFDQVRLRTDQTFYFQTKRPECLLGWQMPSNVIVVTTLETNRDEGYREHVSETAPLPTDRGYQFFWLDHPRKVVTIEPIMDFDLETFSRMIKAINPEYVWIGYNSRPKQVQLPEPSLAKTHALISELCYAGIEVKEKNMDRKDQS